MIKKLELGQKFTSNLTTRSLKKYDALYYVYCCELEKNAKNYSNNGEFKKAIVEYTKLKRINPNFACLDYEMGRLYKSMNDYENALSAFNAHLEKNPNDIDALSMVGVIYKQQGNYQKASEIFNELSQKYPENDFVKRNLRETKNKILHQVAPEIAMEQVEKVKTQTLDEAQKMAKNFLAENFTSSLNDVKICFDDTSCLKGHANMAQYDHEKRQISVTNDFIWANPALVGAYIAHEYIHAKDNDALSSIKEEQDAFKVQAEFWKKYGKNITDPEMDYIMALYDISPQKLDKRVREIYSVRESNFPETSPYHGSPNFFINYGDKKNV